MLQPIPAGTSMQVHACMQGRMKTHMQKHMHALRAQAHAVCASACKSTCSAPPARDLFEPRPVAAPLLLTRPLALSQQRLELDLFQVPCAQAALEPGDLTLLTTVQLAAFKASAVAVANNTPLRYGGPGRGQGRGLVITGKLTVDSKRKGCLAHHLVALGCKFELQLLHRGRQLLALLLHGCMIFKRAPVCSAWLGA